jgi:hypothetical protein
MHYTLSRLQADLLEVQGRSDPRATAISGHA